MLDLRPSWDEYFILITKMVASRSTCLSRQLGAVIVGGVDKNNKQIISTGYNGALPKIKSCLEHKFCHYRKHQLPKSACLSNHAEANAIDMAARAGISTFGSTIYLLLSPCYLCAKKIVMAGIKEVVYLDTHIVLSNTDDNIRSTFFSTSVICRKVEVEFKEATELLTRESQKRQLVENKELTEKGMDDGHT